jgi:hypothetical protein
MAEKMNWTVIFGSQVSYIGKMMVDFPNRVRAGSPVQIRILDAQEETSGKLRAAHPSIVGKSVKDLATRGESGAVLPWAPSALSALPAP